jgi:hypothetical protein
VPRMDEVIAQGRCPTLWGPERVTGRAS